MRLFPAVLALCVQLTTCLNLPTPQTLAMPTGNALLLPEDPSILANFSAPRSKRPEYDCRGGTDYGDHINEKSCQNAAQGLLAEIIGSRQKIISFQNSRGWTQRSTADVVLPYLSFSGMVIFEDQKSFSKKRA